MTSEQRPPVNNSHYFGVPRVVVVHRFDCTYSVLTKHCRFYSFTALLKMVSGSAPGPTLFCSGSELFSWPDLGRVSCDTAPIASPLVPSLLEEFCRKRRLANHPAEEKITVHFAENLYHFNFKGKKSDY